MLTRPPKRTLLPVSNDDYERLRQHLRPHRQEYLDAAIFTGLRRTELESIERRHCDLTAQDIRILGGSLGRSRFVPLPRCLRAIAERSASGLLLVPWTYLNRDLHAACAAVGIEPRTFSDVRETFAARQRAAGKSEAEIARCMGRAQPDDDEREDPDRDPAPRKPMESLRA